MSRWEPTDTGYTLEQAIAVFLADKDNPHTREFYEKHLRRLVRHLGPARDLGHVVPADVRIHMQQLPPDWALKTRNGYKTTIKTFFNWWTNTMFVLPQSPAAGIRSPRTKKRVNQYDAISEDDLHTLISYVKWHGSTPRELAIVLFCADTAPRAKDLSLLQWRDIDLDSLTAVFRQGKGDKERRAAFGREAAKALRVWREYVQVKREKSKALTGPVLPEHYVWNRHGKQILSANISQLISRLCDDAGIRQDRERYKRNGPHMFRHRMGFRGAEAKLPPTTVADMLGHEDVLITLENYYARGWWVAEPAMRQLAWGADRENKLRPFTPDEGEVRRDEAT